MNKDLEKLEKSIKQSLSDGEAVLALDRLHTFTVKKIRSYCAIHEKILDGEIIINIGFLQWFTNLLDKYSVQYIKQLYN